VSAPTLAAVDRDEALTDAIAALCGSTRAGFLRTTTLGGAAMLASLAAPSSAGAAIDDVAILNFGLRFERLQATFYTQAEEMGTIARMSAAKRSWAKTLGAHERAHVKIIQSVLGKAAVKKPSFNFRGNTESEAKFTRTAVAMEDLTTALLTGVTPKIQDRGLVAAAFSLLTVEARHAAWARHIAGFVPVATAFDEPKPVAEVDRLVADTGFISTLALKTESRRRPRFTG
jgi:hypothetical protein